MEAVSAREAEVLAAVGEGLTNAEIARRLHISVRTVESHVSTLLRKLDAADRRALAGLAGRPEPVVASVGSPVGELVGRIDDLAALAEHLGSGRLVTLVAPGGSGKTTLARQVIAGRRAAFADLAALSAGSDTDLVLGVVAEALGVEESGDRPLFDAVADAITGIDVVVVLDNCEHLLDAAASVAGRLVGVGCRVLATSRERLAIPGETVQRLGPLPADDACELFTRRALAADPEVELEPSAVAALCARLDHLPLAIELAAARLAVFDFGDLVARLDRALDLLDGGDRTSARHRSVRNALEWSHDLLAADEQAVHRRLAVLGGPADLATIEAVVGSDCNVVGAVARLCEASLLQRDAKRYRQLDLVRDDARERLATAGERSVVVDRFVEWALATVRTGHVDANHLAAFDAALVDGHERLEELVVALVDALCDEGRWTEAVAVRVRQGDAHGDARAIVLGAEIALGQWRGDDGIALARHAISLALAVGDDRTAAIAASTIIEMNTRFAGMIDALVEADEVEELAALVRRAAAAAPSDVELEARGRIAEAGLGATKERAGVLDREQWSNPITHEYIERLHADGLDPALVSALYDMSVIGSDIADASRDLRSTTARVAFRASLVGHGRPLLELGDAIAMHADTNLRCGNLHEALRWGREAQTVDLRNEARWGSGQEAEALFRLGRFDEALDSIQRVRRALELHPHLTSAYFTTTFSAAASIHGYRGDEDEAADWLEQARRLRHHHAPIIDGLWADVLLHRGDRDAATQYVQAPIEDVYYSLRSVYAAIRAEALGGTAIDDARHWGVDDRFAAGILARAEGDFDRAIATFTDIDAQYQLARTQVVAGGEHLAAGLAGYAALGIPAP